MIQRLLLTSYFIDNKTKPNTIIELFPCWNSCMWVHHCCIISLFMFVQQWHYLLWSISLNVLLISARLKQTVSVDIQRQVEYVPSSPAIVITSHWIASLTFRNNYDTYCPLFSTGTIDLHIDSARIFGCCTSCLVIPVVHVDLHIPSVRSSECKHVMSCIGVR